MYSAALPVHCPGHGEEGVSHAIRASSGEVSRGDALRTVGSERMAASKGYGPSSKDYTALVNHLAPTPPATVTTSRQLTENDQLTLPNPGFQQERNFSPRASTFVCSQ